MVHVAHSDALDFIQKSTDYPSCTLLVSGVYRLPSTTFLENLTLKANPGQPRLVIENYHPIIGSETYDNLISPLTSDNSHDGSLGALFIADSAFCGSTLFEQSESLNLVDVGFSDSIPLLKSHNSQYLPNFELSAMVMTDERPLMKECGSKKNNPDSPYKRRKKNSGNPRHQILPLYLTNDDPLKSGGDGRPPRKPGPNFKKPADIAVISEDDAHYEYIMILIGKMVSEKGNEEKNASSIRNYLKKNKPSQKLKARLTKTRNFMHYNHYYQLI